MKKLITVLIPLLLYGCSSMYIPSVRNIPLFEKKDEGQLEAGFSTNSAYVTASYAVTDKYAVAANGSLSYHNFTNSYDLFTSDPPPTIHGLFGGTEYIGGEFFHRYCEGSIGRYNLTLFPKSSKLEIFAGYGYGNADDWRKQFKSNYNQWFLQGNVGRRIQFMDMGGSLRVAYSAFDFIYQPQTPADYLKKEFDAIHLEPLFVARFLVAQFGKESLSVAMRFGFNLVWPLTSFSGIDYPVGIESGKWQHTTLHFSIGISHRF